MAMSRSKVLGVEEHMAGSRLRLLKQRFGLDLSRPVGSFRL
jgi:hypothetical protein